MVLLVDEPAVYRHRGGVVRVSGPDRLGYLHSLLSQHLEDATPGTVADFLYLDAKGNALAEGRAVVHAEHVYLATPDPDVAADLAAALEKFKFLMQVESVDLSDTWALASARGPAWLEQLGAPDRPMTVAPHGDGLVVRDRSGGVDLLGPADWVDDRLAGLDLAEADSKEWECWRIASGVPGWGSEITAGRRAQELGLLATHVHLRKGCYPGQESIAKIYNLGRPRRCLAVVEFDGPVEGGEQLQAGGKTGEVTSVAEYGDRWLALALLPASDGEVAGGGDVTADRALGRVVERVGEGLPIPGAAPSG